MARKRKGRKFETHIELEKGKHELIIEGDLDHDGKPDKIKVYLRASGRKSKGARVWLSSLEGKHEHEEEEHRRRRRRKRR